MCEAYYYAGIKRLLANDPAAAKDLFKKCMETGVKESTSYTSAAAELDALNKD
jgi:lipoprotein NlpI